jgi:hypothetical protein
MTSKSNKMSQRESRNKGSKGGEWRDSAKRTRNN